MATINGKTFSVKAAGTITGGTASLIKTTTASEWDLVVGNANNQVSIRISRNDALTFAQAIIDELQPKPPAQSGRR